MGTWAKGTTLTFGALVANLTSLSGIGGTADTLDISTHDTADDWREHIGGWADGSEISVEGVYDAGNETLLPLVGTKVSDATITFPLAKVHTFTADMIMTAFEADAPHDGLIGFSASFKISGKPAITVAT